MSIEKHGRLIDALIQRTTEGKIEWRASVLEGRFQVSFKDNTVRIKGPEDGDPNPMAILELINSDGVVVESLTDEELDRDVPISKNYWYRRLVSLVELARRSALGSDKILNEILKEVEDDDIPF